MVGNRENPEENRKHQEVEEKLEFGQTLLYGCARTEAASPVPKSDKNQYVCILWPRIERTIRGTKNLRSN